MSKPTVRDLALASYSERQREKKREAEAEKKRKQEAEYRALTAANEAAGSTLEASKLDEWFPGVDWQVESLSLLKGAVGRSRGQGVVVYPDGDPELKLLVQRTAGGLRYDTSGRPAHVYCVTLQRDASDALFYDGTLVHSPADIGEVLDARASFKSIRQGAFA